MEVSETTSWIKVKIGRKEVIGKAGGYTGKKEAVTPLGDIITMNRIWFDKITAEKLKLRAGKKVTLKIGNKVVTGTVTNWSRGSKQVILDKPPKLTKSEARRIRVDLT